MLRLSCGVGKVLVTCFLIYGDGSKQSKPIITRFWQKKEDIYQPAILGTQPYLIGNVDTHGR